MTEIHQLLKAQLPEYDRALVGWPAILGYLEHLHVRRRNGLPLTPRIIRLWKQRHGFPLLHGCWRPQTLTPCLSTSFAVTSWLLAQPHTDGCFRLYPPHVNTQHGATEGRGPAGHDVRSAA